jgi:hypothetical protein
MKTPQSHNTSIWPFIAIGIWPLIFVSIALFLNGAIGALDQSSPAQRREEWLVQTKLPEGLTLPKGLDWTIYKGDCYQKLGLDDARRITKYRGFVKIPMTSCPN